MGSTLTKMPICVLFSPGNVQAEKYSPAGWGSGYLTGHNPRQQGGHGFYQQDCGCDLACCLVKAQPPVNTPD